MWHAHVQPLTCTWRVCVACMQVLLAEDLGDTFVSFAGRMGVPGIAAGLTSFVLLYLTNRHKVQT